MAQPDRERHLRKVRELADREAFDGDVADAGRWMSIALVLCADIDELAEFSKSQDRWWREKCQQVERVIDCVETFLNHWDDGDAGEYIDDLRLMVEREKAFEQ